MAPIGDELSFAYGNSLPSHVRQPGKIPVFGSNGQVGWHSEAGITGPGIIVGRKGSVGEVKYSASDYWPIDTTYYVVNPKAHNWRYLFYLLKHVDLTGLNSHSAVPGLNREDAYAIQAWFPDAETQEKIANALDGMTSCLALEEHAIISAQRIKQATMHELFTRGLRGEAQRDTEIGKLPESWDLATFADGREWLQYGTSTKCDEKIGDFPVLRIPNIGAGRVLPNILKYCNLPVSEASKYLLEQGDLIFIRTNGVLDRLGSCAVYNGEPKNSLFASYLIRARLKKSVEPRFIAHFYGSTLGTSLVSGRATPASDGKYNLNTGTIDSLPLPLPQSIDEQRNIADVLDAIDQKIEVHQQKRMVLDELFRSLLNKLMTGEISVEDLDLSALAYAEPQPKTEAEVQS